MPRVGCCVFLALLVGLAAVACSHTRVQDVEVFGPPPARPFAKLLVLGIHEDGRIRRLFENAFVAELAAEKVDGVQSYKFIYEERAIDKRDPRPSGVGG